MRTSHAGGAMPRLPEAERQFHHRHYTRQYTSSRDSQIAAENLDSGEMPEVAVG